MRTYEPAEFDQLVQAAYGRIPARFRKRMQNVAMMVEAEPSAAQLAEAGVGPGGLCWAFTRGGR